MASIFGNNLKISIFGQSHAPAVGVVMDGLPAGEPVDLAALGAFLKRRAPGQNPWSTPRKESDEPEILSGLAGGVTCGAPLTAVIRNTDTRSSDYRELRDVPRPGHADYTAQAKFGGFQDTAGGGHFSARLTAPLCVAGGICLQLLARRGISVLAHLYAAGGVMDTPFDPVAVSGETLSALRGRAFPTLSEAAGQAMCQRIEAAKQAGDSVGGIVECAVTGVPEGVGEPIFDGMENRIARIVFGIPAVKGIEFGAGFAAAGYTGSENNDAFYMDEGRVKTRTNRHGGILGGITSGMPIIFRAAFKPTPSIAREQQSVSLSEGRDVPLNVKGRHDPCVAVRAVPVVEAAAAIAVYDALLDKEGHV